MLEANKEASRKSHSDPRILLGFTSGHLLMYRVRTQIYTYNAPRVRDPVDLTEFVEFKNQPIDHIACTRTSNSFKLFVIISQNDGSEIDNNATHDDKKPYVRLVEVYADNLKKDLGLVSPHAYGSATNQIVAIDFALVRKIFSTDRTHLFLLTENASHYFLDILTVGLNDSTSHSSLRQVSRLPIPKETCYEMVFKTLKQDNNEISSSSFTFNMKGFLQTNDRSVIYDTIIQFYKSHANQSLIKHYHAHHDNVEAENKGVASSPLESHRSSKRQRRHGSDSTQESVLNDEKDIVVHRLSTIHRHLYSVHLRQYHIPV
ncbi:hypothetical protein BDF20DRAFT_863367 [Mycotypha africana]|uniref:uncharacterized protein n=1 Tax=Mycotypha africana TaxID=64632 RepID=UPI002300F32D|nr:uncharacterized protein BDF20DRAFT_863367 [Mycotypha africana]KAI8981812.1 hypothetical protein BDF20DRAFT_863367 [Mycotypha africana]